MNQIKLKRIGSEIARELSNICANEARDTLLNNITITGVDVTNDLSLARVYFTTLINKDKKELLKELNDNTASYLRTKIADHIDIRYTPKIKFFYDDSVEYGNNIEKIINTIHSNDEKGL